MKSDPKGAHPGFDNDDHAAFERFVRRRFTWAANPDDPPPAIGIEQYKQALADFRAGKNP